MEEFARHLGLPEERARDLGLPEERAREWRSGAVQPVGEMWALVLWIVLVPDGSDVLLRGREQFGGRVW